MLALSPPWLRIIHVNEGAQLNATQLAALKSLADNEEDTDTGNKKRPHRTLVTLGGNFLGPCRASSIDGGGASLVDQWNDVGVTHACLGLHEVNHLPTSQLSQRLEELNGTCLNTNVPELNMQLSGAETAAFDAIQLDQPSNHQSRRVGESRRNKRIALTGFISGDPNLHSVGGLCANVYAVQPTWESAAEIVEKFRQQRNKFDLIIPLTHQSLQDNRMLANQLGGAVIPLILCGGRGDISSSSQRNNKPGLATAPQQQPLNEMLNGVRLVQPMANIVAVVDIKWKPPIASLRGNKADSSSKISITVQMVPLVDQIRPHPRVLARGLAYQTMFQQTALAPNQRLFRADRWWDHAKLLCALDNPQKHAKHASVFTTRHGHERVNVALSALATLMRLGWNTLAPQELATVLLPASSTTGSTSIDNNEWFTWRDLYREMPHPLYLTLVLLPGQVLQDAITYSRQRPKATAGNMQAKNMTQLPGRVSFIHTCSNVQYRENGDTQTSFIESIQGTPLDPHKEYLVAVPLEWMEPNQHTSPEFFEPLFQWISKQTLTSRKETAQSSHLLIAQSLCRVMWFQPRSLLDLRVHSSQGALSQEKIENLVRAQINSNNNAAVSKQIQNEVSQMVAEQIMSLIAFGNQKYNANEKSNDDEHELVTPVDIMMVDPIVMDTVHLDRNQQKSTTTQQPKILDEVLRGCASDFVGADSYDRAVGGLVQHFWALLGGEEDNQSLDAKIQSRYDSLQETAALRAMASSSRQSSGEAGRRKKKKQPTVIPNGGEVELAELHEPLVRRSSRLSKIV